MSENQDYYEEWLNNRAEAPFSDRALDDLPHDFDLDDLHDFRDPGGRSALRNGKREHPCPTCGRENMLTERDRELGYQCDLCADALEGHFGSEY